MLILSGAPGSGKTAVLSELCPLLPGVVVVDMDEFLAVGSRLAGTNLTHASAAPRWPHYNDLCLSFAAAVLRAGHHVLMLSPLTPAELNRSTAAPFLGDVRWAALDCADTTRRSRLSRRLSEDQIDEALADAADLRALGLVLLSSDTASVEATAQTIAEWARGDGAESPRVDPD